MGVPHRTQDFLGALLAGTTAVMVAAVVCAATSRSVIVDLLSVGRRSVSTAIAEGQ